jgi:hypothetical protein
MNHKASSSKSEVGKGSEQGKQRTKAQNKGEAMSVGLLCSGWAWVQDHIERHSNPKYY